MKKANNLLLLFVILLIGIGILIFVIALYLYGAGSFQSINDITTFSVGVLSLLISGIALIISLITYFSIDAVNTMSSMEGNILCNENYHAEYQTLVNNFENFRDASSLADKLYADLDTLLKPPKLTCMEFTDCLQEILDHILWNAYITKTPNYQNHVNDLCDKMNAHLDRLRPYCSNANKYLLDEHRKLIENVLNYQSLSHGGSKLKTASSMLNIRGSLFSNAISKTIYYDYLGLEYHKKALDFIHKKTQFEGEEFLLAHMKKIASHTWTDDDKAEFNIYLSKASEAFEQASLSSHEDILWKGYISFNKARVDLLNCIVKKDFKTGWDQSILEAIDARYTVLMLLAPKNEKSFLLAEFKKEYYYAKALYLLLQVHINENFLDTAKKEATKLLLKIPNENDANGDIFDRTRKYLNDIIKATPETKN